MNNENNELFNNVKISTGEEEIVLAPPMELFEEAKQIEQNTKSNKKFPFMIHYDVNQREFLLSILETVGAIMEDDDDDGHILATMMNMTQLAFIKQLDCVERVETDEGTNPHIEYSETESKTIEEDNTEGILAVSTMESANNSDINDIVSDSEISIASSSPSERSSCCTCTPTNNTMETAREISGEGSYSGYIGCPGAEQWFRLTTTQSAKYTIYTTGSLDTIGTLCDSCGIPIIEVDDYEPSGSVNFRLNRRLSANTTYYIKVRIDKNGTGSYSLNLTQNVIADYVSISPDTIVLEKGVTYELPITPNYTYKGFNGAQRIPDLSVSLTPSNATEQKISWSSSGDVIEVIWPDDADGDFYIHVTAKNNGTATLFAKDWNSNGDYDVCNVYVGGAPVTSVSLNFDNITLRPDDVECLIATVVPQNALYKNVVWRSSNSDIVEVYQTGGIYANAIGSATITARTVDGGFIAKCIVNVSKYLEVTIEEDNEGAYDFFKITFPEIDGGMIWKSVGYDLFNTDEYVPPVAIERSNYNLNQEFSEMQLAFLYLFDPLGVKHYINRYIGFSGDLLNVKDRIYEQIFGKSPKRFLINAENNRYTPSSSLTRDYVYTDAELVFGGHTIPDITQLIKLLINLTFDILSIWLPQYKFVKWIARGATAADLAFFCGSIVDAFTGDVSNALQNYIDNETSKDPVSLLMWPKQVFNIVNNITEGLENSLQTLDTNTYTLYNKISKQNYYKVKFKGNSQNLFMEEVLELYSE